MSQAGITVIGLGSMGGGMASSLHAAGASVTGFDLGAPQREAFAARGGGGRDAAAAEAAEGAGVAFLVVVNAAQTRAVLFGPDGIAERLAPGAVVVSCATMAPADARALAADVEARGLHYLDAPISGGAARAASGEMTVMASGSAAAFAAAGAALDIVAAKVYRLGEEAGIGAAFKIVNQLLAGVHIAAASEAIVLARRLGLDLPKVYEVITSSAGNSWMFENRVPHVLDGDYTPRSATDIFVKDLGIVCDIGRSERFPLSLSASALQMFVATSAAGMGGDDDASVARLLADIAGLNLPRKDTKDA